MVQNGAARLVTGALDLTGASSGNPININLWSLSGINPDANGNITNFSPTVASQYRIATASGGLNGFDPTAFKVHPEANNGAGGFTNGAGKWTVVGTSNDVFLKFTPASLVYLTQNGIGTNTGETLMASGGFGSYTSNVVDLPGAGTNAGYVTITGIPNPVTDEPMLVMVDLQGTGADIASFLANVQAGSPSDPFTILQTGNPVFDTLAAAYAGPGRTWDAIFEFNPVTDSSNQFFSWNLGADPNVTVDKLVVVPEPATMGMMGFAAFELIADRPRRKNVKIA